MAATIFVLQASIASALLGQLANNKKYDENASVQVSESKVTE